MGGSPVELGPFRGGLNLLEDPRVIAENQLAECINFDVGRGGELTVRPGLKAVRTSANLIAGPAGSFFRIIDPVIRPDGYSRLYVRKYGGLDEFIYYSDNPGDSSVAWTALGSATAGQSSAVVQYVDAINTTVPYAWFIPKGGGAQGVRQNLVTNAVETVAAMPRGSGAVIFRERLFIYGALTEFGQGTYRIYYSAAGDFTNWPVNNFFDVGPGDGETVTNMIVQGDSLIIFKTNSTWVLFFDSDPFLGTLRKANNEIGATGRFATAAFQNEIYLVAKRGIYRMINLQFDDISQNLGIDNSRLGVDFKEFDDAVSVVGNKIVFTVSTGGGIIPFRYYVYHTDIGAWSEYRFAEYPERFVTVLDTETFDHQFATKKNSPNLYSLKPFSNEDEDWGDFPGNMTFVSMATKKFVFSNPAIFKRIFWWAAETVGNNKTFTMSMVADDQRASISAVRRTGLFRSVVKAFTTNRFRNVQFQISSSDPGLRMTLFGLNLNITEKAKVSQDVTS